MVVKTISLFYWVHKRGGRNVICMRSVIGLTQTSLKLCVPIFKLRRCFTHSLTRPASPQASQNWSWRSLKLEIAALIEILTPKAHWAFEFVWKKKKVVLEISKSKLTTTWIFKNKKILVCNKRSYYTWEASEFWQHLLYRTPFWSGFWNVTQRTSQ